MARVPKSQALDLSAFTATDDPFTGGGLSGRLAAMAPPRLVGPELARRIRTKHWREKKSLRVVARELGVSYSTVRRCVDHYRIRTRPRLAAVRLRSAVQFARVHAAARRQGGRCLARRYINSTTKLQFECAEGHRWRAVPPSILKGHWCPACAIHRNAARQAYTLKQVTDLAASRGVEVPSSAYGSRVDRLSLRCRACGYAWEASAASLLSGHGCRMCGHAAGARKRLAPNRLAELHDLARARAGACLAEEYRGMQHSLPWRCAFGHEWRQTPATVIRGSWCPECSAGLGERICRAHFEDLFGDAFPPQAPQWLRTPEGAQLRLDGYNAPLRLAFEHQGRQHYTVTPPFVRSRDELAVRRRYDAVKRRRCRAHGVRLVEIPEVPGVLAVGEVRDYIRRECDRFGVSLPSGFDASPVDLRRAYATTQVTILRDSIEGRGGRLLSDVVEGWHRKVSVACAAGHRWDVTPTSLYHQGTWCPRCAGRGVHTIGEMRELAAGRRGRCLSRVFRSVDRPLRWECAKGHRWVATPGNVARRSWCPTCAGVTRLSITEMRSVARQRGGRCLSRTYVNTSTKLLWRCAKGHTWEALPSSVKRGSWCPECAGRRPRPFAGTGT